MSGYAWLSIVALFVGVGSVAVLSNDSLSKSDVNKTDAYATQSHHVIQNKDSEFLSQNHKEYLASWFATPDVEQDQVLKLQQGYDFATSQGKPFVIDGTYHIKANNVHMGTENVGLIIRDNSELKFTRQGKLKLISENKELYSILLARGVDNYKVYNPHLVGDRLNSAAKSGEWGYGLTIYESSNGYIEKPIVEDVWGDGIYIGKAWGTHSNEVPTNITVIEPFIDGARRNGLTLSAGENVQIIRPLIKKVGDSDGVEGTWPKVCIDIEPETAEGNPPARILNSVIDSPTCEDSYAGLSVSVFPNDIEVSLHIKGLTTFNNLKAAGVSFYLGGNNNTGNIVIDELYYKTPVYTKMSLAWNKKSNLLLKVNKVTYLHEGEDFGIRSSDLIGEHPSKIVGNVTINNIETRGDTFYTLPEDTAILIDGYKFAVSDNNSKGIDIRRSATSGSLGGKDTFIDSRGIVEQASSQKSSINLGNEIWVNLTTSMMGIAFKTANEAVISTAGDYRKLKIGLSPSTKATATSLSISGLTVHKAGRINTNAHCKTLDCWIELQNVEGKETKILTSSGTWTFD